MSVHIEKLSGIAFLAFSDCLQFLKSELTQRFGISFTEKSSSKKITCYGDIVYLNFGVDEFSSGEEVFNNGELPYWARTCFLEPILVHFDSIGEAANSLKNIQRNWAPYQYQCFRRASLIQEKLPYINLKTRTFPVNIPQSPIGVYTLIDDKTILASAKTSSFLPAGRIEFVEDHENPPSRAYLKIQESLTMARLLFNVELPNESSRCFEAGACPGGWTWVLAGLGAKVFAVDRAELAPNLMQNPLVKFLAHDAFTLTPEEVCKNLDCEKLDWVFSDVICYPERLLEWCKKWIDSGRTQNMICTIKMQGAIDWNIVNQFAEIPNSRVVHLNYNKHELTWICCNS